jgi:hypothetical protein
VLATCSLTQSEGGLGHEFIAELAPALWCSVFTLGGRRAIFAFLSIFVDPLALLAFGVDVARLTNGFNVVRALKVVLLAHLVSVAWPASAALLAAQY